MFLQKNLCYTLYQRSYCILITHDIRETDLYKPICFYLNPFLHCIVIVNVYMFVEFICMNEICLNQVAIFRPFLQFFNLFTIETIFASGGA